MNFSFHFSSRRQYSKQAGFSAMEMLVIAGIIIIVSGVVLANVPSFKNRTTLDLIAQEVAISIREAQVFGTATRQLSDGAFPAYGIYFSLLDDTANQTSSSKKIILFADLPSVSGGEGNKIYDRSDCSTGGSGECVEELTLNGPFSVVSLCVGDEFNLSCDMSELAVSFKRPFPDARICPDNINSGGQNDCDYQRAVITVAVDTSPNEQKDITIWNNGQIAVSTPE